MAAWDVFLPRVMVHVTNAPRPLVLQALRDASREFCERSYVWREWIACAAPTNPETRWSFTLPADAELLRLERFTLDGKPVEVRSILTLTRDPLAHGVDEQRAGVTQDLVLFHLLGAVTTGTVKAYVSLKPTNEAATAPDLISRRYLTAIAGGAAARLLMMANTAWSNPGAAALPANDFEAGIAQAQKDIFQGFTGEVPRARINWC